MMIRSYSFYKSLYLTHKSGTTFKVKILNIIRQYYETILFNHIMISTKPLQTLKGELHHIALACANIEKQATFYKELGLKEIQRNNDAKGLRSVWLSCSSVILMLERADTNSTKPQRASYHNRESGFHLAAFTIEAEQATVWRNFLNEKNLFADESDYTLYAYDPEQNRIAFSSYPVKLKR